MKTTLKIKVSQKMKDNPKKKQCSVAKYSMRPPLGKFGPISDQFFQQNQTKIGPKCAPNGKKSDFNR